MSARSFRCGLADCQGSHQMPGATRCQNCLDRARRHTSAGFATVHWQTHDEVGKVESLTPDVVLLKFGGLDEPVAFFRIGVLWCRSEPRDAPTIEITFGEGAPCD